MDGGKDVFCYAENATEAQPMLHYLADGIPQAVCGATPGQLLPYIPLADFGKHFDVTGVSGWRWCRTCCRMMGQEMVPIPDEELPVVAPEPKPRKPKSRMRH